MCLLDHITHVQLILIKPRNLVNLAALNSMDMRAVEDPIFCFVQQHDATSIFKTVARLYFFIMKQGDVRLFCFTVIQFWTEYEWLVHSHTWVTKLLKFINSVSVAF